MVKNFKWSICGWKQGFFYDYSIKTDINYSNISISLITIAAQAKHKYILIIEFRTVLNLHRNWEDSTEEFSYTLYSISFTINILHWYDTFATINERVLMCYY